MNRSDYYSDEEKDVLRRLYKDTPRADILAALPGRNWKAITLQARRLYLSRQHVAANAWGATEDALLREHYPSCGGRYVAAQINRTLNAVHRRAETLGIRSARIYRPRPDSHDYTAQEHAVLRQLYPQGSQEELLAALPGRSWKSLQSMAIRLKIRRHIQHPHQWKPEHDALLRAHYPLEGSARVAELTGRKVSQVTDRAKKLGVRRILVPRPRKPRLYKPTGNPPGRPRSAGDKPAREARLKKLHPNRYATPKAVKPPKATAPKRAPKPVVIAPAPVKRAPATPVLDARLQAKHLASKKKATPLSEILSAMKKLPASELGRREAFTKAAYHGMSAAIKAWDEWQPQQQAA